MSARVSPLLTGASVRRTTEIGRGLTYAEAEPIADLGRPDLLEEREHRILPTCWPVPHCEIEVLCCPGLFGISVP
jgi:hypothetical protein